MGDLVGENKMGRMAMPKLILNMALPMMFSMTLSALYNIIDSYFVSRMTGQGAYPLGEYGINALTLSFPIQMLMIALGIGTGVGINSLLSRTLGENKRTKASLVAGNAIFLGLLTYGLFLFIGLFLVGPYFKSQTDNPIIIAMGVDYLRICCVLSFGSILSTIYEKLLQATGRTLLSTLAQTAGALVNIVLDPIMIFGLYGCPRLGIKGAAYATVISQIIALILCLFFHIKYNRDVDPDPSYIRPQLDIIREIYQVGLPAIMMQGLMSVMTYGINIIFLRISPSAVTAYGIYFKIQQFVFFSIFGLNNAIIAITAYNYGRADRRRVLESIKYGLLYATIIMILGASFLQIFASRIIAIFHLSRETSQLAILAIRIVSLSYPLAGGNIIFQGVFQGLAQGGKSLLISLVRLVLLPLPLSLVLLRLDNPQFAIWFSFLGAEFFALLLALRIYKNTRRQLIDKI